MMRKKIIQITLLVITVLSVVIIFFFSKVSRIKTPAIHAIPADADFILEVYNPFETGRQNMRYPFWKLAERIAFIQSFLKDFNHLDSLIRNNEKTQEFFREATLYISSHSFQHQTQWLFVCNINNTIKSHFIDQFVVKANKDYKLEKIQTDYGTIKRIQLSDKQRFFHYALKNNIWIASMHLEQVKSALRTIEEKNGYTSLPDYKNMMKLQPENTGITFIASIKGLLGWASRIWNIIEDIWPVMKQFTAPGHYTLEFDSLEIHAKGIHPLPEISTIESQLPDVSPDWKKESRYIPAEVQTILSYHISPNLFKQTEYSWLEKLNGCAHLLSYTKYTDFSENYTWLVLPVEDEAKKIIEEICDSVNIDSLISEYPVIWGTISQKNVLNQLPFHTIDTIWNVAGIFHDRIILAKSKESLISYHLELFRQSMANNDVFLKSVQSAGQSKFSWQLWVKPIYVADDSSINLQLLMTFIESICIRWSNKKELVRASANVYFSEKKDYSIPLFWEVSLGGKISVDPIILMGKDTFIVFGASDNILYSIHLRQGRIHWKRQFNESLSLPLHQVYWSSNEIAQVLFSYGSRVYLINADGTNAPGFPLDFKVPVSIVSVKKDLAVEKNCEHELWVITPQGTSSIFSSNSTEGNYYCGKPDGELTCIWLGNNGAITVMRNQRVLFELSDWDSQISSNVFVIWNKTLAASRIVFSDNSNQLVIRNFDKIKIKKTHILQRKQPTRLLNYHDFNQDDTNDFLVVEENMLKPKKVNRLFSALQRLRFSKDF